MLLGKLEGRGHLALLGALAHQRRLAARAEREREGIEQDRFAGAGLAGQHRKAGAEIDVEPIDQDDVADGKPGEHGARVRRVGMSLRADVRMYGSGIRCRLS